MEWMAGGWMVDWKVVWDRKIGIQINIFVNGQVPIDAWRVDCRGTGKGRREPPPADINSHLESGFMGSRREAPQQSVEGGC